MKSKWTFLLLLITIPTFLSAQEVIMSGEALYNTNFSLINGSIMGATIKSNTGKKTSTKRSPMAKLNFVRSESLSKTIQQDFINNLSKENTSYKPALEKVISWNKLRNEFDQLLASYQYSGKNLADAMTAYLVINWQIVNMHEYSDRKGFDAVRKMIRDNLLSSDFLKTATDKDKQIIAETFAYQAMIAMNSYKTLKASRNTTELKNLQTSIDNSLKQSGMDLKAVKLTTNGFVKR